MPIVDITRDKFLEVAQELCSAVADMMASGDRRLKETKYPLTDRDRVLIGLALKIESSFRSVMDDARMARGEAMHHLKTMVEAHLYLHLVIADPSQLTAHRLMAEVCYQKSKFLSENPGYTANKYGPWWAEELAAFERDGIQRIGVTTLKDLVRFSPELGQWYNAVYRAACEPAHITDLIDFMPEIEDPKIAIGIEHDAEIRARFAIDHGVWVMLATIRTICDGNMIGLRMEKLDELESRYLEIRSGPHLRVDLPTDQSRPDHRQAEDEYGQTR